MIAIQQTNPVAYLNKTKQGYVLTICQKPCNGDEFNKSQKIEVSGKKEAKQICNDSGFIPYNF